MQESILIWMPPQGLIKGSRVFSPRPNRADSLTKEGSSDAETPGKPRINGSEPRYAPGPEAEHAVTGLAIW